ncbi:MAG: S8 family serine peptidase [Oscillospiraceae bacterium]|nr:S8 family serine peptidase [Oscillospiraceae bacterium]
MSKKLFTDALSEKTIVGLTDEMLREEKNMNENMSKRGLSRGLLKIVPVAAAVVLVIGLLNMLPLFLNKSEIETENADIQNPDVTADIPNTINTIKITSDDERIYETMENYVFIPDEDAIGLWNVVGYVENIEDFDDKNNPNYAYKDWYWQSIEFFNDGTIEVTFKTEGYENSFFLLWTKGYTLFTHSEVVCAYTTKTMNSSEYMFIEWKSGDYAIRGEKPSYYVFKKGRLPRYLGEYADVRNKNLSNYDFSDFARKFLTLWFNEKTKFPTDRALMTLSEKYNPAYIMEAGKNPGLGVRDIHKQGITGKGVSVAIIDQPMLSGHPEYKDKIIEYTNLDKSTVSMHGPGVTSLLVGENTGTAPGARVYYYAAEFIKDGDKWDATAYATALDMIVEKNKSLPEGEKIRVVSISASPTPSSSEGWWTNGQKYLDSFKRAKEAGILVLDCSVENGIIGACGYDFNNPEDVTLCKPGFLQYTGWNIKNDILVPVQYRTTAEIYSEDDFSYQYDGDGGLSWGIPYAAGVLAMGWEVKPGLSADEMVKILRDTAYVDKDGLKYINPTAFIDYLKNN